MSIRTGFAIMNGLGLAMVAFLVLALALRAARGEELLTPQAMTLIGVGCLLVVARPSWAIAKRIVPDKE